jgi:uncharacterized membrane protein YtjA (UPF0391 family)
LRACGGILFRTRGPSAGHLYSIAQTGVRFVRMLEWIGILDRLHSCSGVRGTRTEREIAVLYTIAVILLIASLLGFSGMYAIGAYAHVLLVAAVVLFVVGLMTGRRLLA